MARHVAVKQTPEGRWVVYGVDREDILETHPTEEAARRAILPLSEQTPEERAARLPTWNRSETQKAREDELVRRFQEGLPLSQKDARDARRILRSLKQKLSI